MGLSIRYENGCWLVGEITKTLQENENDYQDNSIDYISPSEIGGADVYFVDVI